jgi:hypothetical protein
MYSGLSEKLLQINYELTNNNNKNLHHDVCTTVEQCMVYTVQTHQNILYTVLAYKTLFYNHSAPLFRTYLKNVKASHGDVPFSDNQKRQ